MVWQKQSPRVDLKKKFLRISQNSQENTCACVSFFYEIAAWDIQLY